MKASGFFPSLTLVFLVILFGCSGDPGEVGKGLLTAQDTLHLETRVFTATSSMDFLTRVNGNSGRAMVGTYQDIQAQTLMEFTGMAALHPGVKIDSAVLTLAIVYRLRDSTGEFGLAAHNMVRAWGTKTFTWDSVAGSFDPAVAGSFVTTIAASDTAISFKIDTALIRAWSAAGSGSLMLVPSLTAQLILGFSSSLSPDTRPLLTVSYRDTADTTIRFAPRAARTIFVANSTFPAVPQTMFVQAGVDYPALIRFDSLALPAKASVIEAYLELPVNQGASFINGYSRDSLIAYLTRKTVFPYDSLILGALCNPEVVGAQKSYRANVKNIVQQWLTREHNNGLAVHAYSEFTTLDRFALYGADAPANLRPTLTVSYTLFP
jgi:hypothetical protein